MTLSTVKLQTLWRRLLAIVEEQAQVVMRTAFCTIVRESGDLSVVLYDVRGRMLAQAQTGTPGFINTMGGLAGHILRRVPVDRWRPGDAWITNDPWLACGHLHDVAVLSPVFAGGTLVGFVGSAAHVVDIGGRGLGPDGRQIYEEGLLIPPLPLFEQGRVNDTLLSMLRENVREAAQVEGDVMALAAANTACARAVADLLHENALPGLDDVGAYIIATSEAAMRRAIAALPAGTYPYRLAIDGYDRPLMLAASATIMADGTLALDFAGTSSVTPHGINVPLNYSAAYAFFAVKCALTPEIPTNAGTLAPVTFAAPVNAIVNAQRPWPVSARHMIGHLLPDLVFGCLGQAKADLVPAEGASSLWGPQFRGGAEVRAMQGLDPDEAAITFTAITVHSGGSGGRPGKDGLSATAFPTNLRTVPVEVIEAGVPLIVWRRELKPDSGGAGQQRGGLGQVVEIAGANGQPFLVNAMFERIDHPARGRDGGADGAPGRVALASGGALKPKGQQIIPGDDRLVLETPGGGGLGDARRRDPGRVAADVAAGLVTNLQPYR